jgi:hypothetical protein
MPSEWLAGGRAGGRVVLWLGRDGAAVALAEQPAASPMDFTGWVMHNFIYLDPAGVPDDAELEAWLHRAIVTAVTFTLTESARAWPPGPIEGREKAKASARFPPRGGACISQVHKSR